MITQILLKFSIFVAIVPMVSGLLLVRRLKVIPRIILVFSVFTLCLELVSWHFSSLYQNNLFLYHIFTLVEFALIGRIYYILLQPSKGNLVLKIITLFYIVSALLYFHQSIFTFNSFQRFLETGLLLVLFYHYLFLLRDSKKHIYIEWHPYFVLTTGLMFYFIGTSMLFLFSENLIASDIKTYWIIHSVLNIFLNGIFTFVLWKAHKLSM